MSKTKDPNYFKIYYQTHKDKFDYSKRKPIFCEICEKSIKSHYQNHLKSEKHILKAKLKEYQQ